MTVDPRAGVLPFSPDAAPPVGTLERRVLNVLWRDRRPHTARDVREALREGGDPAPAYTTVATVLGHLFDKDLLARELTGRVWSYEAALTGCQFSAAHMVRSLAETNDRERCLTRFVGMLDDADREYLRSLL